MESWEDRNEKKEFDGKLRWALIIPVPVTTGILFLAYRELRYGQFALGVMLAIIGILVLTGPLIPVFFRLASKKPFQHLAYKNGEFRLYDEKKRWFSTWWKATEHTITYESEGRCVFFTKSPEEQKALEDMLDGNEQNLAVLNQIPEVVIMDNLGFLSCLRTEMDEIKKGEMYWVFRMKKG